MLSRKAGGGKVHPGLENVEQKGVEVISASEVLCGVFL